MPNQNNIVATDSRISEVKLVISIVGDGLCFLHHDEENCLPLHLSSINKVGSPGKSLKFAFIENNSKTILEVNDIEEFYIRLRVLYLFSEANYEVWMTSSELSMVNQIFDHLIQELGCRKAFFEFKIHPEQLL